MVADVREYAGHLDDCPWESRAEDPTRDDVIRWKKMVDRDRGPSGELSLGMLEFPIDTRLRFHHHAPAEIYFVRQGTGEVTLNESVQRLDAGGFAFIPGGVPHAIANVGTEPLQLLWFFPTDSWHDVEYIYLE
jgi:mannose-6-phosphate isomerase-like protein (cupin superfamily)